MYTFDPNWLDKLATHRAAGREPYAAGLRVTHTSTELHELLADVEDPTAVDGFEDLSVGGRVMFRNRMGRAIFLRLKDRGEVRVPGTDKQGEPELKGGIIQVYARRDEIGDEAFALLRGIDIGDIL